MFFDYIFHRNSVKLMNAVKKNNIEKVKELLKHGKGNVNFVDQSCGATPLHYATTTEMISLLLQHGAHSCGGNFWRNKYEVSPFHSAVWFGYYDKVKILLELDGHNININRSMHPLIMDGLAPLGIARKRYNKEMESLLIQNGATLERGLDYVHNVSITNSKN